MEETALILNREYQGSCKATDPHLVGNGVCNIESDAYTPECRYDGGDCCYKRDLLKDTTTIEKINLLGDFCNPAFNTDECLEDYGRCSEFI